ADERLAARFAHDAHHVFHIGHGGVHGHHHDHLPSPLKHNDRARPRYRERSPFSVAMSRACPAFPPGVSTTKEAPGKAASSSRKGAVPIRPAPSAPSRSRPPP